jgi:anti-sigma-K factor RskA
MRCEQIDELAGAYALYAATSEEIAAVELHLESCDKHPDIAGLLATTERLAAMPDELVPSPELKTRLMAAINADLATERATESRSAAQAKGEGILVRLFSGPRLGFGLAAAAAVVVALVVILNPWGDSGSGANTVVGSFGDIRVEITYDPSEPGTSMTVTGLDPAPIGSVYQVWAITDGSPVSLGFLDVPDSGEASADMDVQLAEGQTVAVTVEPEGGSPLPTTAPVFGVDI